MKVIFENPGLIDLIGVRTFGVNAKVTESPIGFFGTGLKYAIAVILRNGGKVVMYRGTDRYEFTTKPTEFRDKNFNLIYMNDEQLAFTTELGKTWQMWQAFRELHCNALDEDGKTYTAFTGSGEEGLTKFVVTNPLMEQAYATRGEIFIEGKPIYESPEVDIYRGRSKYAYLRGVRVHEFQSETLYKYNFKGNLELTEDRTLKYSFYLMQLWGDMLLECEDKELIENLVTAPKGTWEEAAPVGSVKPSKQFLEVVGKLRKEQNVYLKQGALKVFSQSERETLMPGGIELLPMEQEQLKDATAFLSDLGFSVNDYPIVIVETLGENVLGLTEHGKIFIARRCLDMGTKQVASCMLEEWVHLKHGYADCSRGLQTYLFDKVMAIGSRALGRHL